MSQAGMLGLNGKGGMGNYWSSEYCNPAERCRFPDLTGPNQSGKKRRKGDKTGSHELADRSWRRSMGGRCSPISN